MKIIKEYKTENFTYKYIPIKQYIKKWNCDKNEFDADIIGMYENEHNFYFSLLHDGYYSLIIWNMEFHSIEIKDIVNKLDEFTLSEI